MDDVIPGFVRITAVAREYATSRKSVERRRDKARATGDSTVYRQFKLRTKDGETFDEPSLEQVKKLRADGRVPEWFVTRDWLEKTFGKRKTTSEEGSEPGQKPQIDPASLDEHPYVRMLKQTYGDRISDLQEQLRVADRREERMTKVIEAINKTTQALNQTLALPGIAEATRAQQQRTIDGAATESGQSSESLTVAKSASSAEKNSPRKNKHKRKGWLQRLLRNKSQSS